jgi:hypothetical protein
MENNMTHNQQLKTMEIMVAIAILIICVLALVIPPFHFVYSSIVFSGAVWCVFWVWRLVLGGRQTD